MMPLISREKSSLKGRWRLKTVQDMRSSSSNPVSCSETSTKIYGSKEEIGLEKARKRYRCAWLCARRIYTGNSLWYARLDSNQRPTETAHKGKLPPYSLVRKVLFVFVLPARLCRSALSGDLHHRIRMHPSRSTRPPFKYPKAPYRASAHPRIAAHGASASRTSLPPPEKCADRRP